MLRFPQEVVLRGRYGKLALELQLKPAELAPAVRPTTKISELDTTIRGRSAWKFHDSHSQLVLDPAVWEMRGVLSAGGRKHARASPIFISSSRVILPPTERFKFASAATWVSRRTHRRRCSRTLPVAAIRRLANSVYRSSYVAYNLGLHGERAKIG